MTKTAPTSPSPGHAAPRLDKLNRLERQAEAKSAKRARRKDELADHAVAALKQLGYARTSLRDIAEISGVAVGTLHYYFEDKVDLINYCVQRYKIGFLEEMEAILASDASAPELSQRFAQGLAQSIRQDAATHRLWYDIRNQAGFDPAFLPVVGEIETALSGLIRKLVLRMGGSEDKTDLVYLMLDATFRTAVQGVLAGDARALDQFEARAQDLLPRLLQPGTTG